jgi:uncharacterized membrane protein (DUF441 family)
MDLDLGAITTNAIVVVPIVLALTQAIKLTGFIPDHFAPLVAIGVGIIVSWLGNGNNGTHFSSILLSGAIFGLISSGLYSGVKTTMQARNRQKVAEQNKNNAKRGKFND